MSSRLSGSLLAIGAALVWGTAWVATGLALRDFTPAAVAAWRGIGSTALMAVLLIAGAGRWGPSIGMVSPPVAGRALRYLTLALLGGPWFVLGMTLAVELTGATIAAFVAGLYPVLAAAAAPLLLPERPSWLAIGGLIVAFTGVLLLAGLDPIGLREEGVFVALVAASVFAIYLLLARRWSAPWRLSPMVITASNLGLLALTAVPLAVFLDGPASLLPNAGGAAWLSVAWLVVGASVLANLFVVGSVRRLPAHESSAYLMLSPLTAALLAVVLLDERLQVGQVAGAAFVLAGIAAATLPFSRWRGTRRTRARR